MKVNTFIIGVQKAGTTSLYEWLIQHPEVCGEIFLKDYPFFIDSDLYTQGAHILENRFNCNDEPVVISGCVDYVEDIASLKRIKAYNPDSKIILILRKHQDRMASAHKFLCQLAKEDHENINTAIANDREYLDRSLYAPKIDALLSVFAPENVKIILFEQMVQQSETVLREVFDFLSVDSNVTVDMFNANKTAEPRFKAINKVLFDKDSNQWFRSIVKTVIPPEVRLKIVRFIKNTNTKGSNAAKEEQTLDANVVAAIEQDKESLKKYLDVKAYW